MLYEHSLYTCTRNDNYMTILHILSCQLWEEQVVLYNSTFRSVTCDRLQDNEDDQFLLKIISGYWAKSWVVSIRSSQFLQLKYIPGNVYGATANLLRLDFPPCKSSNCIFEDDRNAQGAWNYYYCPCLQGFLDHYQHYTSSLSLGYCTVNHPWIIINILWSIQLIVACNTGAYQLKKHNYHLCSHNVHTQFMAVLIKDSATTGMAWIQIYILTT